MTNLGQNKNNSCVPVSSPGKNKVGRSAFFVVVFFFGLKSTKIPLKIVSLN